MRTKDFTSNMGWDLEFKGRNIIKIVEKIVGILGEYQIERVGKIKVYVKGLKVAN